MLEESL